jgi:hypothetical protein
MTSAVIVSLVVHNLADLTIAMVAAFGVDFAFPFLRERQRSFEMREAMDFAAVGASWFLVPLPTLVSSIAVLVRHPSILPSAIFGLLIFLLVWVFGLRQLLLYKDHGLARLPKLWRLLVRIFPLLCVGGKVLLDLVE